MALTCHAASLNALRGHQTLKLWFRYQKALSKHGISTFNMATDYFVSKRAPSLGEGLGTPPEATTPQALRSNPLSTKVTSVLSASYADSDIREALALLDKRNISNTAETRRQIRLDVQKEVIESNGEIIREFGQVAEVSNMPMGTAPVY